MKAWAVVGANYGDEGKGLMTDYLVRKHNIGVVCRYNGGAQAGHTVQLPDGKRHVFHHFSSGTFAGALTYLGPEFLSNPYLFVQEYAELKKLDSSLAPRVLVHPDSPITTPYDMLLNQAVEKKRGGSRHGSCGVGILETIRRHENPVFRLTARDLHETSGNIGPLLSKLQDIRRHYVPLRAKELGLSNDATEYCMREGFIDSFIDRWQQFASQVSCGRLGVSNIQRGILFEGAQGLALSQNAAGFPHLTPSFTGSENIITIAKDLKIEQIDLVYATRSYLTRHGAGPFRGPDLAGAVPDTVIDKTNVPHDFQGTLRMARMDHVSMEDMYTRINKDIALWEHTGITQAADIAVTCLDQCENNALANVATYQSFGPTHEFVMHITARQKEAVA